MNNEKVYGSGEGVNYSAGTETEAVNRFWRNIFAGCAASRFHRPAETWGSGINKRVQINLDPWIYMDSLKVKWLDIDNLTWSEPELVKVEWEGDINDWGKRGSNKLTTPSNRSYVVLLEDVD